MGLGGELDNNRPQDSPESIFQSTWQSLRGPRPRGRNQGLQGSRVLCMRVLLTTLGSPSLSHGGWVFRPFCT